MNSMKGQKKKIVNSYVQLRQEAFNESAIDITRQTVVLMIGALRLTGNYTDDQLRDMFDSFVTLINRGDVFGKPLRSDEMVDYIQKELGIDMYQIKPKIGD